MHTHTHAAQGTAPSVGDEGFVQEPHTLSVILKCLPKEVRSAGARKQVVSYLCFDVSDQYLALGSEQGYVWILDLHATKLTREINVSSALYLASPSLSISLLPSLSLSLSFFCQSLSLSLSVCAVYVHVCTCIYTLALLAGSVYTCMVVCMTFLASSFLPSSSLINMYRFELCMYF